MKSPNPKGSRSFSTGGKRCAETLSPSTTVQLDPSTQAGGTLPTGIRIPSDLRLKHRYDPLIHQVTNLLMQDGKLGKAQRVR